MADSPTWDLLADLQLLLRFHFMQNAFIVGTLVAVLAGAVNTRFVAFSIAATSLNHWNTRGFEPLATTRKVARLPLRTFKERGE